MGGQGVFELCVVCLKGLEEGGCGLLRGGGVFEGLGGRLPSLCHRLLAADAAAVTG